MNGEIDRKVLHAAMLKLGVCLPHSLCALDTAVRIGDGEEKLLDCRYCVFKDVVEMLVCPNEIRDDIEDVLKLR